MIISDHTHTSRKSCELIHANHSPTSMLNMQRWLSRFSRVRLCDPVDGSLLRPWDSPGKNAGVGCHFLLQCMKMKSESEVTQSCLTLCDPMDCSLPGSSVHGSFQARVLGWGAIAFSVKRWGCQQNTLRIST